MENQVTNQLFVSHAKAGILITNKDPFLASKVEITTHGKRIIKIFDYTPLLTIEDAKELAKVSEYNEKLCIELFEQINQYFCRRIGFFYADHEDIFDLPKGMKIENVKKRVISKADIVLHIYEYNKVKESLWQFAATYLMDKDAALAKEVESAAKMEFNHLETETKLKKKSDTTLTQQILLLEHFGIINLLKSKTNSTIKTAKLLSYLLNKDEENIRHSIMSLNFPKSNEERPKSIKKFRDRLVDW